MRAASPALWVLSPGTLVEGEGSAFVRQAEAVLGGERVALVLREPALSDRELLRTARALAGEAASARELVLHDRVHLAEAAGARGVQLGFRSLPPVLARAQLPPTIAVGFSAHAHDDPALWEGAERLLFGPVRATPSKRGLLEPSGFDGLARAVRAAGARPVWALGGMRAEDAAAVRASGAAGWAVLSGVWEAADPAAALHRYLDAWEHG